MLRFSDIINRPIPGGGYGSAVGPSGGYGVPPPNPPSPYGAAPMAAPSQPDSPPMVIPDAPSAAPSAGGSPWMAPPADQPREVQNSPSESDNTSAPDAVMAPSPPSSAQDASPAPPAPVEDAPPAPAADAAPVDAAPAAPQAGAPAAPQDTAPVAPVSSDVPAAGWPETPMNVPAADTPPLPPATFGQFAVPPAG